MKQCSRCIMPETAKGITLDQNGLCQLCNTYKRIEPKGKKELLEEINNYVDKDAKYNCIVPISGGRDSSYALFYAKEELGLKPIAVHNDNDFETEIARKNLKSVTKKLDVPLIRTSAKNQLSKKIVAEKFKFNAPFGPGLVAYQACEACKYGFESASYNTARKEGIQVIIWGDSTEESTAPYRNLIDHETSTKLQRLLSPQIINLFKYKYYFNKLKQEYGSDSPDGLKEIHLYDYIEWDRKLIVDTIQQMGWTKPDDSPTSWRIDCGLVPIINYLTQKAYGVSKIELGFSNMVRSGKMDREDAIIQAKQIEDATDINELKRILKTCKLSDAQTNKILS